jgi:hypothetical protein
VSDTAALQPAAGALLAYVAFDAGAYFVAWLRSQGDLERLAEPVMLAGTVAAVALALALGGRWGDAAVVALLWARCAWDALHLGDGNVLQIELPRDFALASMVVKLAASVLFLLFLFSPQGA